jgi:hypothetical protein
MAPLVTTVEAVILVVRLISSFFALQFLMEASETVPWLRMPWPLI